MRFFTIRENEENENLNGQGKNSIYESNLINIEINNRMNYAAVDIIPTELYFESGISLISSQIAH